jgi:hypothetical protein
VLDRTRHRAHGRVEIRTLKAVTVRGLGFPHASQVLQVTRKTRDLRSRRWRTVVVDAVTSLAHARASLARLADLLDGHWLIENGLHWVRDVTFTEDASQVRSGTAPQVMACLGNLALACCAGQGRSTSPPRSGSTAATPTDPWRPWGSASRWASLHSFLATMLKLRLTQRPASRHRWPSVEPAGCSGPRQVERSPRRGCPVVPSLSGQAILMDRCLEVRASGLTRMLAGR